MTGVTHARHLKVREFPRSSTARRAQRPQWQWLLVGLLMAFLLPFLSTDLTSMDRDLYYGILAACVFGFVARWLQATTAPRTAVLRNWRWGIVLGLVFFGLMVPVVLREPSTPHPHGLDFAVAIVWRGIVYGFADGLLLSAFPIVAVFSAFAGMRVLERWRGKVTVGAMALAVSVLFTAVYHLGYSDFRGAKLRKPIAGDLMWSVPTLVTLSPLASPITHAGLHVSAVVHSYDTTLFLPPHEDRTEVNP